MHHCHLVPKYMLSSVCHCEAQVGTVLARPCVQPTNLEIQDVNEREVVQRQRLDDVGFDR